MTDTTHDAPERIWVEHRTCTVDASGAARLLAMDRPFSSATEYVRVDLVQAAVAAALREAAQAARLSISERDEWPPKDGDVLVDDCMAAILALITPDSQAALDRVVWAERERCAKVSENFGCCHVPQEIAAAIREGGE